jgi:hypothetical protein
MNENKRGKQTVQFNTVLKQFSKMGEKTGWTYFEVPAKLADKLSPGNKKAIRVKGKLDNFSIKGVSLLPMGQGNFIMPFNASMRKGTGKIVGGRISVSLEIDPQEYILNKEMMQCIRDEPEAFEYFKSLTRSHQNYFSKWVDSAKSNDTKAIRIARILNALVRKMNYAEMLRAQYK